ncbi:MAG: flavin-dependent oxidoreductase [Acidimicrobiia bacterium]|nr:flavin-dependent oxidoreductase [Acidimicrobiia bacterium]
MGTDHEVVIVGAGIGGLTLALSLHQIGVETRIFESVSELQEVGAGINLLPHAVRELDELGVTDALDDVGIRTQDASYFNQYGQRIYTEPAGLAAGYPWPQYSIHRADLQSVLLETVHERLGPGSVVTGHKCVGVAESSTGAGVTAVFEDPDGEPLGSVSGRILVGCDGIHSAIRKQFYPEEGPPVYSGIMLWRGVTPHQRFLSGANTARLGWMDCGKLTIYPVRNDIDEDGNQLVNWVASLRRAESANWEWHGVGALEEFFEPFSSWHFEWLDVAEVLAKTDPILIFPMVDRDPVPTWSFGPVTMLGDAAHPMYPRGSNGAGQAILDARYLAGCLKRQGIVEEALQEYDRERVAVTSEVVLMGRRNPPDAILREVYERTGGEPFVSIDDVIPRRELEQIAERYRQVARFDVEHLRARESYV